MSEVLLAKTCRRCSVENRLGEFHRQPTGVMGRHSWCKVCVNAYARTTRNKRASPEQRKHWSLRTRYGIGVGQLEEMRQAQHGLCAICEQPMRSPKVDHDHQTGQIRGLRCHRCNLRLSGIEDAEFLARAQAYLPSTAGSPAKTSASQVNGQGSPATALGSSSSSSGLSES